MTRMRKMPAVAAMLSVALTSVSARAQQPSPSQAPATTTAPIDASILKGMFPVYVVEKSGDQATGKLVSLTTTELVLETPAAQTRTFKLDEVAQVYRKGDSLKNGAIIGAIVGAAAGALVAGECSGDSDPSSSDTCGAGTRVTLVVTSIAAWAAIGTAIDALISGRTLIWKSGR